MENKDLHQSWSEAKEIFRKRKERSEPEFPTGLSFLDNATDGLSKGELWIIAGKSGRGKTSLAVQIANSFAENPEHSILFLSLEMKGWELTTRMFCEMNGVNYTDLKKGFFPVDFEEKDKCFKNYISTIDFEIYEHGYNFNEIVKILTQSYKDKKPDVIFIDFLQLIEWRKSGDERTALDEYIRKLKELANTQNIGIVVVSQLRRLPSGVNYERPPDIIDLKGSGLIEQAADKIILIYGKEEDDKIRYYINLAKNRQGETITEEVIFQGWFYRFKEIEKRY